MSLVSKADMVKYGNYTTQEWPTHPLRNACVGRDSTSGDLARWYGVIYRVPSRQEFVLRMFGGATAEQREDARKDLELMPRGLWAVPRFRDLWTRGKFANTKVFYASVVLGEFIDEAGEIASLEAALHLDSFIEEVRS